MDEKTPVYSFGDVRVDAAAFRVWRGGEVVSLEPKAFEVLLFLVQNRGRVVLKSELLDAVWSGTAVTENALTREIAQLRKALGEDARHARFIETVPTRGYRFIGHVENGTSNGAAGAIHTTDGQHTSDAPAGPSGLPATDSPHTPAPHAAPGVWRRPRVLLFAAAALLVAGLAALGVWYLRTGETVAVRRLTQVTTSTGFDTYPSISPDGNSVAYSSDRGGGFDIYVRQLAPGGREIRVTDDGENFQPAWSPDGRHIAYYSRRRGGIWLVPALGGAARRLTEFGSKPAWSRDGESIAFQSAALSDLSGVQGGALPPSTIWLVPAAGGEPRQLTKVGQPSGGHGAPVFWPDGKRVLFYCFDLMMGEVWSVSIETGETRKITSRGQAFSDLIFAPDGKAVYFAGQFRGNTFGLWRVPVSIEAGAVTGEPVKVEGTGATPIRHLSISADGKKIAYSTVSVSSNIWQVPVDPRTGEAAGQPAALYEDTSMRKTNPVFSPDGRRVAFGVWRLGAGASVMLMEWDGSDPHPLLTGPSGAGVPNWTPDGQSVAFLTQRDGRQFLVARSLDGGAEQLLAGLPDDAAVPRLSPDGRRVVFNSRRSGLINVWSQEVGAAAEPRQLTDAPELAGFPCWSPDGRWLALEVMRGGQMQVAVIPAEGGEPEVLTDAPGLSWPHDFSPDGDRVAFAGFRDGRWNVYWVSRTTRRETRLTSFTRPNAYVRYPAWSPAGDRLVFEYAETTGNVWLLELK